MRRGINSTSNGKFLDTIQIFDHVTASHNTRRLNGTGTMTRKFLWTAYRMYSIGLRSSGIRTRQAASMYKKAGKDLVWSLSVKADHSEHHSLLRGRHAMLLHSHLVGVYNEAGPLGAAAAGIEDARDAIGLGEQRGVDDGEAEAGSEALHAAHDVCGSQHEGEGDAVAEQYAAEQHVAELAARGAHHRRVIVAQEDAAHEQRQQDACGRERHGTDGPAAGGTQEHLGNVLALGACVVGYCALGAACALRLIQWMSHLHKPNTLHYTCPRLLLYQSKEAEVSMEQRRNVREGANGSRQKKPAHQRHRPTRLPCANIRGATQPGIESDSSWWEASSRTTTPPRSRLQLHIQRDSAICRACIAFAIRRRLNGTGLQKRRLLRRLPLIPRHDVECLIVTGTSTLDRGMAKHCVF
ncbi:hypothetical protein PR048_019931 [Dryococelus australis]|uniref:Uncharacterized protein n=1 Tax=Dryococelus australis TaxID=614101 RepID=A0ABQ9H579_9NEOP|nr:hypothetical protein PR048_019931 [Dryococelus australis]